MRRREVLVASGGPVRLCLALLTADARRTVTVVEARVAGSPSSPIENPSLLRLSEWHQYNIFEFGEVPDRRFFIIAVRVMPIPASDLGDTSFS